MDAIRERRPRVDARGRAVATSQLQVQVYMAASLDCIMPANPVDIVCHPVETSVARTGWKEEEDQPYIASGHRGGHNSLHNEEPPRRYQRFGRRVDSHHSRAAYESGERCAPA